MIARRVGSSGLAALLSASLLAPTAAGAAPPARPPVAPAPAPAAPAPAAPAPAAQGEASPERSPATAPDEGSGTRPKVVVVALGTGDVEPTLAENLTDVLLAEVARRGTFEMAGSEEFRERIGHDAGRALACLGDVTCLGRIGAELGVTKVLGATVGRRGDDFILNVNLFDLPTGKVESRVFQLVPGGVKALIATAQDVTRRAFEPRPEPGGVRVSSVVRGARVYVDDAFIGSTPVRAAGLEAGKHLLRVEHERRRGFSRDIEIPAGGLLEVELPEAFLPERRTWPGYTALGMAVGAAIAGSAGAVLGILSQQAPSGTTRRDVLADVDTKKRQAEQAGLLGFVTAGLAVGSAVVLYVYRADVFGYDTKVAVGPGRLVASLRF